MTSIEINHIEFIEITNEINTYITSRTQFQCMYGYVYRTGVEEKKYSHQNQQRTTIMVVF